MKTSNSIKKLYFLMAFCGTISLLTALSGAVTVEANENTDIYRLFHSPVKTEKEFLEMAKDLYKSPRHPQYAYSLRLLKLLGDSQMYSPRIEAFYIDMLLSPKRSWAQRMLAIRGIFKGIPLDHLNEYPESLRALKLIVEQNILSKSDINEDLFPLTPQEKGSIKGFEPLTKWISPHALAHLLKQKELGQRQKNSLTLSYYAAFQLLRLKQAGKKEIDFLTFFFDILKSNKPSPLKNFNDSLGLSIPFVHFSLERYELAKVLAWQLRSKTASNQEILKQLQEEYLHGSSSRHLLLEYLFNALDDSSELPFTDPCPQDALLLKF
ncbi:MAG: hypothetical protein D6797_07445 [Bdellovibrio sp.]|nr:MAG: hypothetical protein D6797_07445 [Bdellovibrio sp.]